MKTTPLLEAIELEQFERVIVLSPHLDDAALSCGGLLASLRGTARGLVITISCADPIRARKGFASSEERRIEDQRAMESIGCSYIHLGFEDAVYRRSPATGELIYLKPREKWQGVRYEDAGHVEELSLILRRLCLDLGRVLLLAPMGVGFHVDHAIAARVALRLARGRVKLLFYEDFPYVADPNIGGGADGPQEAFDRLGLEPAERHPLPIEVEEKARLIEKYPTQVPVLFGNGARLRTTLAGRTHKDAPCEFFWRARPKTPPAPR